MTKKVEVVTEAARKAVAAAYTELSEELLEERVAMAEELAQKQRELKAAWERSDATVRVAASLEQAKEAAEVEKKKTSAALEQLRHEKSATLLRSQQAETKANAAEAKKEALRMATEEMIALLAQVNPDMVQPMRDALKAAKTPSPQQTFSVDLASPIAWTSNAIAIMRNVISWSR